MHILKKSGIDIPSHYIFFLDRYCFSQHAISSIPVFHPNDPQISADVRAECTVLLALYLEADAQKEIYDYLYNLGYKKIYYDISFLSDNHAFSLECSKEEIFEKEEIYKVPSLLCDGESRKIFTNNLRCHWRNNYEEASFISEGKIYFQPNFTMKKGVSCVIDCGANTGQTLENEKIIKECDTYIGFEPDQINFTDLCQKIQCMQFTNKKMIILPLAVAETCSSLKFESTGNGASRLSANGNKSVTTVCLDDVLSGVAPTLIKMDIEGAELSAVKGIRNIIEKYKPDLAICLYHRISDLWRIPLLIHECVADYKIAIRSHYIGTWETVMYASVF